MVLRLEKRIQFLDEIRIQFHESLVETDIKHSRFLFCQLKTVDALQQVVCLLGFYLSAHQFSVVIQLADIQGTDIHKETHVGFASLVGIHQSQIEFSQLFVLYRNLLSVFLQTVFLFSIDYRKNQDDG